MKKKLTPSTTVNVFSFNFWFSFFFIHDMMNSEHFFHFSDPILLWLVQLIRCCCWYHICHQFLVSVPFFYHINHILALLRAFILWKRNIKKVQVATRSLHKKNFTSILFPVFFRMVACILFRMIKKWNLLLIFIIRCSMVQHNAEWEAENWKNMVSRELKLKIATFRVWNLRSVGLILIDIEK